MPDHINIHHPQDAERREYEALKVAKLEATIKVLENGLLSARSDLEAIFTRIERGDPCELHMKNGDIFILTGALRDDR